MLAVAHAPLRSIGFIAFLIVAVLPTSAPAQGVPVETGSHLPVALWFIGVIVLGGVIAYGVMRNRTRTRAEKQLTEQATKDNYRRGERNG